jgi:archaellin
MTRRIVGASRETWGRISRAVRGVENGGRGGTSQPADYGSGDDADSVLCKTTAAWSKNSSATLQVWAGEPGSETNTGVTLTAYNRVAAFKSGDFVTVQLNRHGFYYVVGAGGGSVKLSRTTSVWEKGTTTSLVVYGGTPGSEAATGETFNAFNNFGKVLSGKWVMIGETAEGQNYLIAPESDQVELVYTAEIVSTTASGVTTSKLVFRRKKVWVHSIEEGTPVEIGMTECVTPYSNNQGGY